MKFTKASKNDNGLVTVSIPALSKEIRVYDPETGAYDSLDTLVAGQEFVIRVNGVSTTFTVNREGRTAVTKGFPMRSPSVGRPVNARVNTRAVLLP